ncbi:MAG: response regulator transcription factor [Chloroflexota bacterium]|nr:response regulator transcription factor [Anaerolineales bacterium]MCB8968449.1 response regulator transcription factor [Ardenticatenaceae bacterium]
MKALVVDDDRVLADLIAFTLRHEGFQVQLAYNGESALRLWQDDAPDVIVLDLNLPKLDGFAVCRHIRAEADTPIIMLTVRGEDDDIVRGLEMGADDYVTKPFSPRQLVARIQAVLRRAGKAQVTAVAQVGDLFLDSGRREVRVGQSVVVTLTRLEAKLLHYFMVNVGHVLTNEAIIAYVWGPEGGDRDMVRQLVRRLRRKIEPDAANPLYIETVSGVGYSLVDRQPMQ